MGNIPWTSYMEGLYHREKRLSWSLFCRVAIPDRGQRDFVHWSCPLFPVPFARLHLVYQSPVDDYVSELGILVYPTTLQGGGVGTGLSC
jgi:hypothetical protein